MSFALAAAGGGLAFLGFAGFGIWPLSLVCLIPLWQALDDAGHRRGLLRPMLLGFAFGLVAYGGGFSWMWRIVNVFLAGNVLLGAAFWLADAAWFALRFALYGALYARLRRHGWPVLLAGGAPLLVIEWLYPLLFPVYLGHSLVSRILLIQISDLGGPLLLTAFLVLINAAVCETWRWMRGKRGRPVAICAGAVAATAAVSLYGSLRMQQIEAAIAAAPGLEVAIVQGNLGVFEKGQRAAVDHRTYLQQTRELLRAGPVDLVVWPETVYTRGLRRPLPISGRLIREELSVPLLFGAASVDGSSGRNLKYNSALLIGADGVIREAYDKNVLIPFTEYVPFADTIAGLSDRFAGVSAFSAGTRSPALTLGAWRISTPICHEAVQASYVRRMVLSARPHLIATLANDSWFGDSQEPWLHLAMARFRAVEHRRYLVRATNSGVSAIIDPLGQDIVHGGLLVRENLRGRVHLLDRDTVYTRWGDWPGWLALLATGLALVARRPGRPDQPPPLLQIITKARRYENTKG